MFKETFTIAIKAILANKTRSTLTMLGLIIGVAAVILLVSIGSGLQNYIGEQFDEMGANLFIVMPGSMNFGGGASGPPNFSSSKLSETELSNIRQMPQVKAVTGSVEGGAFIKYRNQKHYTQIQGEDDEASKVRNIDLKAGRQIQKSDITGKKRVAIIGATVVEELFGKEEPLGKQVIIEGQKYEVIGVLEKKGASGALDTDNYVQVPSPWGKEIVAMDNYTSIYGVPHDGEDVDMVKKRVERVVLRTLSEDDFSIMSQEELLGTITQILGVLTAALGGIAAISLVVGGVGIMNIMLVSVTERTREIGIRKAIGAKRGDILLQFLVEAVTLSLLGGLGGVLLGIGGSAILGKFLQTSVTPFSVALSFGVSATIGVVFGIAPAYKASRKSAIDALRYE
ncbi:MAG: ABC transporter permease [bacterium]